METHMIQAIGAIISILGMVSGALMKNIYILILNGFLLLMNVLMMIK